LKEKREIKAIAEKLARQNYQFTVQKDEMGYYVTVPDLKGCSTWVTSLDELEQALYEAKLAWIEAALERGIDIPKPTEESQFSGKFLVRCPKTIHKRLVENARREGVSLNQYVVSILAQSSLGDRAAEIIEDKIAKTIERGYWRGLRSAERRFSGPQLEYLPYLVKYSSGEEVRVA